MRKGPPWGLSGGPSLWPAGELTAGAALRICWTHAGPGVVHEMRLFGVVPMCLVERPPQVSPLLVMLDQPERASALAQAGDP